MILKNVFANKNKRYLYIRDFIKRKKSVSNSTEQKTPKKNKKISANKIGTFHLTQHFYFLLSRRK